MANYRTARAPSPSPSHKNLYSSTCNATHSVLLGSTANDPLDSVIQVGGHHFGVHVAGRVQRCLVHHVSELGAWGMQHGIQQHWVHMYITRYCTGYTYITRNAHHHNRTCQDCSLSSTAQRTVNTRSLEANTIVRGT